MSSDVEQVKVQYLSPASGLTPTDLAEIGAILAATGLTTVEARGLMGDIQQAAAQTALTVMPKILEGVRKVQEARIQEMVFRIRALAGGMGTLGYVSRERVIQVIQDVAAKPPRT